MQRSTDRILTTHVGSLVRPPKIRDVMDAKETGTDYDEAAFQEVLRTEVKAVVGRQAEIGIDVISDGEYGKAGWFRYLSERLGGLELREIRSGEKVKTPFDLARETTVFPDFYATYFPMMYLDWLPPDQTKTPIGRAPDGAAPKADGKTMVWDCTGPITYQGLAAMNQDLDNFRIALADVQVAEAFLPVAAPMSARGLWFNSHYPNEDEVHVALADALKEEYNAIVDAGFLLQVDDAYLAHEYDRMMGEMSEPEVRKQCEMCIDLLNYALEGIPPEKIRYHVCWGSWNAPHTTDIPLSKLADFILKVNADAYSLEGANPRHEHEWQLWKDVKFPDGKILVPGVITHSTNVVEHPELIAMRIANYASVVGKENVIASSDCGFAQSYNIVRCHPDVQWAKLESLAEGAKLASKQLWQ
jgi:5-methyltetrahydropteroyltriglutamate--homocysteine methyltransferase